jgi:hypothetical protein
MRSFAILWNEGLEDANLLPFESLDVLIRGNFEIVDFDVLA